MEFCPDFNPHKYLRDIYSSLLGKGEDYFHSILIEEEITPQYFCGGSNLEGIMPDYLGKG